MSEPQKTEVDAASLIVSYLWGTIGNCALKAELGMVIHGAHERVSEAQVYEACMALSQSGWIDLTHDGGLPAARLTPEAVQALQAHVRTGAPMPERLVRAADRALQSMRDGADAQILQAQLLREVRDEARQARQEAQELRLELQRMREAQALPGPRPQPAAIPMAPAATWVKCGACGGLGYTKDAPGACRPCGGQGLVRA